MSVFSTGQVSTWCFGYPSKGVKLEIVHGKNDRRQCKEMYNVSFTIPEGSLTKLLLAHIFQGQHLLTHHLPEPEHHMFVRKSGSPFTDAVFTQYWGKLMGYANRKHQLAYFPPSLARTIFVEDYTSVYGSCPDVLQGAAAIMGNTVEQWGKSYNPSKKRRLAQQVVAGHQQFTAQVAGQGAEGEEREGAEEAAAAAVVEEVLPLYGEEDEEEIEYEDVDEEVGLEEEEEEQREREEEEEIFCD